MLKNRIIPCLDVKNGRVVKGINFVDLKDAGDPVEQAKIYSDGGADEICFLDITASNENRDIIYDVVEKTSKKCFVPLTVGGGIRSVEDMQNYFDNIEWTGGSNYVVQLGDQIDRSRKGTHDSYQDEGSTFEIVYLLFKLNKLAQEANKSSQNHVFSLLGNHEIMNVQGNMK